MEHYNVTNKQLIKLIKQYPLVLKSVNITRHDSQYLKISKSELIQAYKDEQIYTVDIMIDEKRNILYIN